jgi:hypothetical protein
VRQLGAQARHDLLGRVLAHAERLEGDEHPAGVAAAAARPRESDGLVDVLVVLDWRSLSEIRWNEVLWSAWMNPNMRPVSCSGKNPLGMMMKSQTVSTTVDKNTISIGNLWSSTQASDFL